MLISDATAIYYGDTPIYKAYLGENLVWGKTYITSKNNLSDGGYTVGTSVNKTTATANKTTLSIHAPGPSFTLSRKYWTDWGDDIFDGWGFFYLYDPAYNNYLALNMANMQEADGVISQDQFIFNGKTYTVKYGYPVQGIFKIDVKADNHTDDFVIGFDGNLGSNGSTINSILSQSYTLEGQSFKLYYNYNIQSTVPAEKFYTYFVPREADQNKNVTSYTRILYDIDNLSLYSVPVKSGITVYVAKQTDVKNWVINDLQLGTD